MEITWIAIIASLLMGIGALLIFIFAVKQDYFRDLEDTKYQVFWSDLEELVESSVTESSLSHSSVEEKNDDNGEESQNIRT
ncbi:MAG: cbb3-type cytochrome oxidase assembly protein CcoS [Blastocatellales bacterium]